MLEETLELNGDTIRSAATGAAEVEKHKHRFPRNEPCGDLECSVSERVPVSRDSGYSRQLVWLDRKEFRTIRIRFFDRGNPHLKTTVVEDYRKYLHRFRRASRISMTNHLTKKSTVLHWKDYAFGTDLDLGDFTRTALKRAR